MVMNLTENGKPSDRLNTLRKLGIVLLVLFIIVFYILSFRFLSQ